ncbi:MAG: hypothetical protein ACI80L_001122, partial [Pseudohongiellaceae bacterium]
TARGALEFVEWISMLRERGLYKQGIVAAS